jgi:hypothetical protein
VAAAQRWIVRHKKCIASLKISIFAGLYNLLAKWLGGFEVEVKDIE